MALVVLFAGLNWTTLIADASLNLAVMQVQAPMVTILLSMTALFVALFFIGTLYSRNSNPIETRRLHKELRAAQDKASNQR